MNRGNIAATRETSRYVELSWERCRSRYSLNPTSWRPPTFIGTTDLDERREAAGFVYAIAQAELGSLGRMLRGPIGLTVTDHEAVILAYAGNPPFTEIAQKFGLRPGAVWRESEQGTNGMGTCLSEQAPVAVEQQQHYLRQNAVLSCYGVPILDGRGGLAGVVNASALGVLQPIPTMALLDLIAQNIETRSLLARRADYFVLHLHQSRQFLSTSAAAILLVSRTGTVERVNRAALKVLAAPSFSALCGTSVYDLLGLELSELQRIAHAESTEPRFLPRTPYFAVVQPPLSDTRRRDPVPEPCNVAVAMKQTERRTIISALGLSSGSVTEAAKRLGVSRRSLHRKLLRYGICRENYQQWATARDNGDTLMADKDQEA